MLTQYADFALFQDKMKANFSNDRFRFKGRFMGMGCRDEKCSLLIERCRAGRFSLLFAVQQSFRSISSLGCVGCSIALCLSSQRNAISFSAHCVCHRSLSLLSSPLVAFVIDACRVCYRCLSLLSSPLIAFVIAACFVWCCFFLRSFLFLLSCRFLPLSARLCWNAIETMFALCAAGCFVIV